MGPSTDGPPAPAPAREYLGDEATPRRARWTVVVGTVVALALGVWALVDHRARQRESASLDECARAVATTLEDQHSHVSSIAEYVRVAATGLVGEPVRGDVLGLISTSAEPAPAALRSVRTRCAAVEVSRFHGDLADRRLSCLRSLDQELAWFEAVLADGRKAYATVPATDC